MNKGTMKKIAMVSISALIVVCGAIPAFAASKKKITSVSLTIDSDVTAGTSYGSEDFEIDVRSEKYSIDGYDIVNEEFDMEEVTVPELEITLTAAEGYYFAVTKATQVKLKGNADAEYISGKKRDSSTTLVLTVKLRCIENGVGEVSAMTWDNENPCTAKWESTSVNNHELLLYRNGKRLGNIQEVPATKTFLDLKPLMTRQGDYTFKVRGANASSGKKGEWSDESDVLRVDEELARKNRDEAGYVSLNAYGWQKDEKGWWYKTPGGYPANEWKEDNEHWFYFDNEGYMVMGWHEINGNWYYFNEKGEMLANTVLEGYQFDESGACMNP